MTLVVEPDNNNNAELISPATEVQRLSEFARLAADWYWELDAGLKYVYHEVQDPSGPADSRASMLGELYTEALCAHLPATAERAQLIQLLERRESIDLVLPISLEADSKRYARIVARPRHNDDGEFCGYTGCGRDVTRRYRLRQRLEYQAAHDELTGLHNRREFESRLQLAHEQVESGGAAQVLCMIDLDRFKLVNDTAGHAAGDQLLIELAALMSEFMNETETLARLGGDEFGMLLHANCDEAIGMSESLIDAVASHQFVWEGRRHTVGASIGITPIEAGSGPLKELLDRADSACYAAKHAGRNQCVVFRSNSDAWLQHRAELKQVNIIRDALQANRLRLFMQAIRPAIESDVMPHYEILLRLETEHGELLPPSTFIPIAEHFNFMQELDQWVLEHCLDTLDAFMSSGMELSLSINLSGNTLSDRTALERIVSTVRRSEVPTHLLCFEITESAAISNIDHVMAFMRVLKRLGVRFALDDFGAGMSSFAYIRSLPIDYLKIDGYFIRNIRADNTSRAITAALIGLSQELGLKTVAESVEDKATRRAVSALGIDYVQGFGIERPRDVDEVLAEALAVSVRRVANG
ncbi:MAG: EAL domain-containing protein [Granulosicoccus sp.]